MNCPDFVRAGKGGHHPEQSLTTYDKSGLFPFPCLLNNIPVFGRYFKHRMTGWGVILAAPTLSFDRTHFVIRSHTLCHPDRSGEISSSWQNTFQIRSE